MGKIKFSRSEKICFDLGYRVLFDGKLIDIKGQEVGYIGNTGYLRVNVRHNGKRHHLQAHRLQAYQKYGEAIYQDGIVVRHLNGNKLDNSIDNIHIGTQRDNSFDRSKEDRVSHAIAATRHIIKYNPIDVINYHKENGNSYKKTMEHFGIKSKGSLHYVLNKRKVNG